MARLTVTAVVCAMLLWAGAASALDTCTATINSTNGTILVGANNVSGTLLWGNSPGTETNAFYNAGTCVTGSPLVAKNCKLGKGGTALAITPPPLCRLYLKDGAGSCSAYITTCTPGARPLVQLPSLFVDNGNGRVTDTKTGLMWEQKTATVGSMVDCSRTTCSNPQDVNNTYQWSAWSASEDFLARTNGTLCADYSCPPLAGHTDWRLPTLAELETILVAPCGTSPCIDPVFGPTQSGRYWSSTTFAPGPHDAWDVGFNGGGTGVAGKGTLDYVRAVRSGL